MWTTIVSFLKGKVFTEAGSLIIPLVLIVALFAIWNSESILTKFGFETTSTLKAKVATLESKVSELEEANKKLTSDLLKAEQKGGIVGDATSAICVFKEETKGTVEDIKDRRKKNADRINNTEYEKATSMMMVEPPPTTPVYREVKKVETKNPRTEALSRNNIESIHEAYNLLAKGASA